jgi:hypothetical protein
VQRAKEAELLFIGGEYKRAIAGYYGSTPGALKQLPKRLEDLLRDSRYPVVRRHLRKIYVDPMTGRSEWGIVATPAGITGVYSLSEREPFRKRAASLAASAATAQSASSPTSAASTPSTPSAGSVAAEARRAVKYSDWKFIAEFEQAPAAAEPGAPVAAPQAGAQDPSQPAAPAISASPRTEPPNDPDIK